MKYSKFFINFAFLIITSSFISGCGSLFKNVETVEKTKRVEVKNATDGLFIIGDNQFHNIYADPNKVTTPLPDIFANVSVRPPQLNIFSKDLFLATLLKYSSKKHVIHLGDALNVACESEWNLFVNTINKNGLKHKGWVMAPGNHDFYYYGNTAKGKDDKAWRDACGTDGTSGQLRDKRMKKNKFISYYLKSLLNQSLNQDGFPKRKNTSFFKHDSKIVNDYEYTNKQSSFLKAIVWHIDEKKEWTSFIIQKIKLPSYDNTVGILIDTANYEKKPTFLKGTLGTAIEKIPGRQIKVNKYNAGVTGQISRLQFNALKKIMNFVKNEKFIVFGHHPYKSLSKESKEHFKKLFVSKENFIGYISAHTHKGYQSRHSGKFNELNVGSITDYKNQVVISGETGCKKLETFPKLHRCMLNVNSSGSEYLEQNYTNSDNYSYGEYHISLIRHPKKPAKYQQKKLLAVDLVTYYRLFKDLGVLNHKDVIAIESFVNDINILEQKAKTLLSNSKHYENLNTLESIALLKQATVIDNYLIKNNVEYNHKRLEYGVRQALWAAQSE